MQYMYLIQGHAALLLPLSYHRSRVFPEEGRYRENQYFFHTLDADAREFHKFKQEMEKAYRF